MSKEVLGYESNFPILVNQYYGGKEKGQCIQFTNKSGECYSQMTRREAIKFLKTLLEKLGGKKSKVI